MLCDLFVSYSHSFHDLGKLVAGAACQNRGEIVPTEQNGCFLLDIAREGGPVYRRTICTWKDGSNPSRLVA